VGRSGGTTARPGAGGFVRANGPVAATGGSGDGVRIVADPRTNTVMVYSTFAIFKRIREVLRALDVPQSQLAIEAMVLEVELNDKLDHGVQMYLQGPHIAAASTGDPLPQITSGTLPEPATRSGAFVAVGGRIGKYRVDAVLSALQAITKVKVISSPYLTVLDGKTARLVVGDQIPYSVRSQTSQNTGNVTVTQEVEIKDTGIILDVTPRIYSDNSVALRINQSVSTPSPTVLAGNTTPVISTRNVESNVLAQSGRTILLGGLIQDRIEANETGVPVLRAAPVIGDLFKTRDDRVRRVELLVMITPRVIRHTSQIEDITRLIRSQMHAR
jgi:general secretion pathway protein D